MERYTDNGLCNHIKASVDNGAITDLQFYDIEKSLLVVAQKKDNRPIALFIDDRCEDPSAELTAKEKKYGNVCYSLAKQAKLPLLWIRYVDVPILTNDDFVYVYDAGKAAEFRQVKMRQIVDILHGHGIPCELENKSPRKGKNDSLSSAFHLWQRECLKVGIFADIDLIRMDGFEVKEILELKRSFYSLDAWRPFYFDINNFAIIKNLCNRLGDVPFKIIYNTQVREVPHNAGVTDIYYKTVKQQSGEVYYDKLDRLKVFDVELKNDVYFYPLPYPVFKGFVTIEEFLHKRQ